MKRYPMYIDGRLIAGGSGVPPAGLVLREVAPGFTAAEVQRCTEAKLIVPGRVPEMKLAAAGT